MSARVIRMAPRQRRPETAEQARRWQERRDTFYALGIGADACLTGVDAVQAAFATGENYGPPLPPCQPCADLMASWGTRAVGQTGYYRLPAASLPAHLTGAQAVAGVVVPAQRHAGTDSRTEVQQ